MKQRKLKKKEEEMIHRDKRIDATSPLTWRMKIHDSQFIFIFF
jgi:hypothetical protein